MTRTQLYFVVDAFTHRRFAGNPAAVVPLTAWPDDALLQQIAAEMALSETAFFAPEGDGFRLRWMTPTVEVELCGHATLAAGFVLMHALEPSRTVTRFHTRSGTLTVTRKGDTLTLDLPARVAAPVTDPALLAAVAAALGATPLEVWRDTNLTAVFADAAAVRALAPDMRQVATLPSEGVIVTAPGGADDWADFVSRYFTPQQGIDEDPVTGSAHCTLGPYWAARLERTALRARQISRRGGELTVEVLGDRVHLGGHAVLVARGDLLLP